VSVTVDPIGSNVQRRCYVGEVRLLVLSVVAACASSRPAPEQPRPLPTAAPVVRTTLTIHVQQTGVHVFVDGVDMGEAPLSLPIAPGKHDVRFEGERYVTSARAVTIAAGESLELHDKLAVTRGRATLVLRTPDAMVELVSGADRRVVPQFPLSIDIATDHTWTIEAKKPGYRDFVQPIRFDDGVADKTFAIELQPN
jgi:hypothetical protein